jgi:hypothetical protein
MFLSWKKNRTPLKREEQQREDTTNDDIQKPI